MLALAAEGAVVVDWEYSFNCKELGRWGEEKEEIKDL